MDAIIRGANVYVDEINQRRKLDSAKLPTLKREMLDHYLGGGYYKFSLASEIAPLEAEFMLDGVAGDLHSRFGRDPGDWTTITIYQSLLDATGGDSKAVRFGRVVLIRGLISEIEQPAVNGMKAKDKTKVKMGSIVKYQDILSGVTVHKFDVVSNTLVVNTANYSAEHNRLIAA